jgi:hypothetical protein
MMSAYKNDSVASASLHGKVEISYNSGSYSAVGGNASGEEYLFWDGSRTDGHINTVGMNRQIPLQGVAQHTIRITLLAGSNTVSIYTDTGYWTLTEIYNP